LFYRCVLRLEAHTGTKAAACSIPNPDKTIVVQHDKTPNIDYETENMARRGFVLERRGIRRRS
jgi:hypothetical protein